MSFSRAADDNIKNNITSSGDQFNEDDYNDVNGMNDLEENNISSDENYEEENNDYYLEEEDEELDTEPVAEDQKTSQPNLYKKKGKNN